MNTPLIFNCLTAVDAAFAESSKNLVKDVADDGTPYAYLTVDAKGGGRPSETHVRLSTGHSLGHIQRVTWSMGVGEIARCQVETILDAAELKVLARDTEVKIRLSFTTNPYPILWAYAKLWVQWHLWYRWTKFLYSLSRPF